MMFPFRSSPSLPRVGLRHLARPNHARQAVANRAVPSSASRRSSRMPRTPRASSHPLRTCGMGGDVGLRASSDAVELRDEGDGAGDDAEHEASVKHRVEQVLQRWGHSRLGRGEDGARDSRARAREQGRGKLLRVANVGARPNGGGLPRGSTWPGWRETTNERRRARASVGGFESAAARGHSVRELAPSLKRVRRARSRQPDSKGSTIEGSTTFAHAEAGFVRTGVSRPDHRSSGHRNPNSPCLALVVLLAARLALGLAASLRLGLAVTCMAACMVPFPYLLERSGALLCARQTRSRLARTRAHTHARDGGVCCIAPRRRVPHVVGVTQFGGGVWARSGERGGHGFVGGER